ncbi:MAG: FAD-dependent monooxygenase [Limnochordaceae bacterium]|nr:FAD-dependent monooxygenase [Limnochordaceae bacterium]
MVPMVRVAVVGAGPGGLATAVSLSRIGMRPVLINRSADRLRPLLERPVIEVEGIWQGVAPIARASTGFDELRNVDVVIVTTPATAHGELAERMAPFLDAHHVVILHPGRTLGALEFASRLQRLGTCVRAVAETDTLLYTSRSPAPGRVRVSGLQAPGAPGGHPALARRGSAGVDALPGPVRAGEERARDEPQQHRRDVPPGAHGAQRGADPVGAVVRVLP